MAGITCYCASICTLRDIAISNDIITMHLISYNNGRMQTYSVFAQSGVKTSPFRTLIATHVTSRQSHGH